MGVYFGPVFIVSALYWSVFGGADAPDWRRALVYGLFMTLVGWIAFDIELSVSCADWHNQGYGDKESCRMAHSEDHFAPSDW